MQAFVNKCVDYTNIILETELNTTLKHKTFRVLPPVLYVNFSQKHHHIHKSQLVLSSIVFSHTREVTVLTNMPTRISPHVRFHLSTKSNSRMQFRTCERIIASEASLRHVSNDRHLSPSSTPSSASAQLLQILLHHARNDSDYDYPKARY